MNELGDIVAEHENRISFLENSLPGSAMSYCPEEESQEEHIETEERPRDFGETNRMTRLVYQLKNEVTYLHKELYEVQKLLGLHGEVPRKRSSKY